MGIAIDSEAVSITDVGIAERNQNMDAATTTSPASPQQAVSRTREDLKRASFSREATISAYSPASMMQMPVRSTSEDQ